MDDIKTQLLKTCREMMDALAGDPGDEILGAPPKVFYLDFAYMSKSKFRGSRIENPLETYRYQNGSLEKVEPGTAGNTKPIRGSYFSGGHFAAAIDKKNKYAYIGFQLGPRFGRGFRYKIVTGKEGNTLADKEKLWMS